MELLEEWRSATRQELSAAIELRHELHAAPRLSGDEEDTAKTVAGAIGRGDGERVAGTGRLIEISPRVNGKPAIALRTELDALPIREATKAPWRSNSEVMHCCGHDVHMAALTAVVRAAGHVKLPAPLVAVLQPREEGSNSGARDLVAEGALEGVDAVIAAHVQPQLSPHVVAVTPGAVNAGTDEFEIVVRGRGGHAGYPHTVDDSVLALSSVVVALQQISARRINPVVGAVCMVNQLRAGSADNVVAGEATGRGTVRTLNPPDRAIAHAAIRDIAQNVAAGHGCSAEVSFAECEPPLYNDADLAVTAFPLLLDMGHQVSSESRSFGSDDFSHYCATTRGLMAFVGTGTATGALHDSSFLPGDEYVGLVADALIAGYCAAALTSPGTPEMRKDPTLRTL